MIPPHTGLHGHDAMDLLAIEACSRQDIDISLSMSSNSTKKYLLKRLYALNISIKYFDLLCDTRHAAGYHKKKKNWRCDFVTGKIRFSYRHMYSMFLIRNQYQISQNVVFQEPFEHTMENYIVQCPVVNSRPSSMSFKELFSFFTASVVLEDILFCYSEIASS